MARDNNTGKTKGFYERGQAIFDAAENEQKKLQIITGRWSAK
jgi:hypothetical protein